MENGQVGAGVFGPRLRLAIPMGTQPSIFQAETFALRSCVEHCLQRNYRHAKIFILSDSKAALQALDSYTVRSKLVWDCMLALNLLGTKNTVTLMWVPGHSGIQGNEMADQLAKEGGATPFIGPQPFCGLPKSHQSLAIKEWEDTRAASFWRMSNGQRQAKRFLSHSTSWTKKVLLLGKNELKKITGALTGHCPVNYHLKNIRKVESNSCRFCKEAVETSEHLLCWCEAVHHQRLRHLGSRTLEPGDICQLVPRKVVRYLECLLPEW